MYQNQISQGMANEMAGYGRYGVSMLVYEQWKFKYCRTVPTGGRPTLSWPARSVSSFLGSVGSFLGIFIATVIRPCW